MPVTRKRKIEVARLAGFGLVLAGLFALFLAVMSAQNAGAVKAAPRNASLQCHHSSDDGIGAAVQYGACDTTTTLADQGGVTSTTERHYCGCNTTTTLADQGGVTSTTDRHHCGCNTTTTEASEDTTTTLADQGGVTSTTEKHGCGCNTTTTEASEDTTTTLETTTTLTESGSPESSTTIRPHHYTSTTQGSLTGQGGNTTGPEGAEAANAQELPFTGSSSFPLAGFGLLLVVTGLALSLRRRRLAR